MEDSETLQIVPTLVPFILVIFIISLGVVLLNQQFRKNIYRKQLEQEELKRKHQLKLLKTTIAIQEEERKRIAQDLHDELGAALSMSKMQLLQMEKSQIKEDENLIRVRELVESALESTRRISRELMPLQLEQLGLKKALLSMIHFAEESGTLKIKTDFSMEDANLTPEQQLGLYRIFSELLNNSLKYADATQIHIEMKWHEHSLLANYRDDGVGIEPDSNAVGLGLKSIGSRVGYLNGTWDYGNHPDGGFYSKIILPLK